MLAKLEGVLNNNEQNLRQIFLDLVQKNLIDENIIHGELNENNLIDLLTKILIIVGTTHDIFTPAGGDTFKMITGLDEEEEADKSFKDNSWFSSSPDIKEFIQVINDLGLNAEKVMHFAAKCITGESDGVIAQFIKSSNEDTFDSDRAAYTYHDNLVINALEIPIPSVLLREDSEAIFNHIFLKELPNIIDTLERTQIVAILGFDRSIPSNSINVNSDWETNQDGKLVCTNIPGLLRAVTLRTLMGIHHYSSAKMFGLEIQLKRALEPYMDDLKRDLLSSKKLLSIEDHQLYYEIQEFAKKRNDSKLFDLIVKIRSFGQTSLFSGQLTETEPTNDYFHIKRKLKPGLDTLIKTPSGEIHTLRDWMNDNKENPTVELLEKTIKTYNGKWLSVEIES